MATKLSAKNLKVFGGTIYLVIKLKDIKDYPKFIRIITGLIARHVLNRERGPVLEQRKKLKKVKFWIARPFTRIIAWGRDYNYLHNYMEKNINQAKAVFTAWGFDVVDIKLIQLLSTG